MKLTGVLAALAFVLNSLSAATVFKSGFEEGSIEFPEGWSLRDRGMSMVASERAKSGRRALRIVDSDADKLGSSALSERFSIRPGQRARVSLWCWLESGDSRGLGVYIEFIDLRGKFTEERMGFRQRLEPGKWNRIVVDRIAPPGTAFARIWLHSISASVVTCVVDDIEAIIEKSPTPISMSNWEGTTMDPDIHRVWPAGLRWHHGTTAKVDRKFLNPQDWSAYQTLAFNLYSERNTGSSFVLIIASENDETEGGDYFSLKVPIDFRGWKSVKVPLADLRVSRQPVGFGKIDAVKLRADGYSQTVAPDTVVVLDGLSIR